VKINQNVGKASRQCALKDVNHSSIGRIEVGLMPADFGTRDSTRPIARRVRAPLKPWLRAYWAAQRDGEARVRLLSHRVAAELGHATPTGAADPAAKARAPALRRGRGYGWIDLARLAPALWRRSALLVRDLAAHPDERTTIVAISFKRLACEARTLRPQLADLARALPGAEAPNRVGAAIAQTSRLLVFEPAAVSALAPEGDHALADRVYVIDYATIVVLALMRPLAVLRQLAVPDNLRMLGAALLRIPSARGALPAMVFAGVYEWIAAHCARSHAYLFTSFSFATEALRLVLLHSPDCDSVCEILHGIPSEEFDEFVEVALRGAPGAANHCFIGQIPVLPIGGAIGGGAIADAGFAVNSAANAFFMSPRESGAIECWIDRECGRLYQCGYTGRELVVTLIGAGALENDAFDAGVFAAEQALVSAVCEVLRSRGVPFLLLYAPHPMYEGHDFAALPLFVANRVVCAPTFFTWLISDACVALYSSALFEAAYAGAQVFTPIVPGDRVYSAALLDCVHTPRDGEACDAALRRFLSTAHADTRGLQRVAAERAARLNAFAPH